MVDETEKGHSHAWAIGLFIFILIIIAIIIIIVIARPWVHKNVPLQQSCDATHICATGLICDSGICKVPINGPCTTVLDCISSATGCIGGVCVSGQNLIPLIPGPTGPTGPTGSASSTFFATNSFGVPIGPIGMGTNGNFFNLNTMSGLNNNNMSGSNNGCNGKCFRKKGSSSTYVINLDIFLPS